MPLPVIRTPPTASQRVPPHDEIEAIGAVYDRIRTCTFCILSAVSLPLEYIHAVPKVGFEPTLSSSLVLCLFRWATWAYGRDKRSACFLLSLVLILCHPVKGHIARSGLEPLS